MKHAKYHDFTVIRYQVNDTVVTVQQDTNISIRLLISITQLRILGQLFRMFIDTQDCSLGRIQAVSGNIVEYIL